MLDSLQLLNFKGFKEKTIPLRHLTMLSGINSMGKSTVLQALALLRQSYQQGMLVDDKQAPQSLVLNGELVTLGTGKDIFCEFALEDKIGIGLTTKHSQANWMFGYDSSGNVLQDGVYEVTGSANIFETGLFTSHCHYIQADRIGPRTSFDMDNHLVRVRNEMGSRGEFAAHYLELHRRQSVDIAMHHPFDEIANSSLFDQVQAWMDEISPGTQIRLLPLGDIDRMQVSIGNRGTEFRRPTNVGFGILYTLPILVAILSSQPNAIVLLENPEAHLHPKGQAQMGHLIARAVSAGVQIILETHSDHILNGIRIATREYILKPEQVALHFFTQPDDFLQNGISFSSPQMDAFGRLDHWPENFFDEWDRSLDKLL
ncbi:DUF3696 domain-containing protein [Anaerolineales bacterium HSG24]|nr:DUF3696 domain-containing protein [Anaerolineales bacterium HSG24]